MQCSCTQNGNTTKRNRSKELKAKKIVGACSSFYPLNLELLNPSFI